METDLLTGFLGFFHLQNVLWDKTFCIIKLFTGSSKVFLQLFINGSDKQNRCQIIFIPVLAEVCSLAVVNCIHRTSSHV